MSELHASVAALKPTGESERIDALDLIRGIALLGILFVNMQAFGETFGTYTRPVPEPEEGTLGAIAYYWVSLFCESRFYPVFSMLFGIGLTIQWTRAVQQGRNYTAYGLRRLFALMAIGLFHALVIWWGDILFVYSVVGLLTLPLLKARPQTLLAIAIPLAMMSALVMAGLGTLKSAQAPDPAKLALIDQSLPPFQRLMQGFDLGVAGNDGTSDLWVAAETEAFRDGPFLQALLFRALTFCFILIVVILAMGWNIWSMFLTGAALYKLNFFARERAAWHRWFAIIGLGAGFPMVLASDLLVRGENRMSELFLSGLLHGVGTPVMSLGYMGAFTMFAHSKAAAGLKILIARVGRMGLTNYLLESVLATFVFYHWGLGKFGETTRIERMGLVIAIYLILVVFSSLWLKRFRFGPMEWLWRTVTYLKPQPMRRAAGTAVAE